MLTSVAPLGDDRLRLLRGSKGEYPYDEGKHLFAMIVWHAFGDDSGTHQDAKFCLLLGYVGSPRQWKLFRREWQAALTMLPKREGKKPEFHARDFFQRERWQSRDSPYWRWNDTKADTFLNALLDAIHRYNLEPIGGATKTEDFFAYSEIQRRCLTGAPLITRTHWYDGQFEVTHKFQEQQSSPNHPYFVVFPGFLWHAIRRSGKPGGAKVHIWLDRQKAVEARAGEAFDLFKKQVPASETQNLGNLVFTESEEEVGIQAADLYAYVWYRKLCGSMTGQLPKAFERLTRKRPGIVVIDKAALDRMLIGVAQDATDAVRRGFERHS